MRNPPRSIIAAMRILTLLCALLFYPAAFGQTNTNSVVTAPVGDTNKVAVQVLTISDEQRSYLTFGLNKVESLQHKVLGVELWQYVASLLYIFLAFAVSKLLDYIVRVQLAQWASKTKARYDDLIVQLIRGPVKIISFVILLHIGLAVFDWPDWIEKWFSKGLQLIVAISITYVLLKLIDVLLHHWRARAAAKEEKTFNDQLFPIINKSLKLFVVIVAALVTSQNMGLNITGLLASLSIGGLALGLAAQDTVANLFGAVAVFVDKPFKIGDFVKVDGVEGVVESIGLRSTRLRNHDGHLITVPNKTMGNTTITNVTVRPNIRTIMDFGVTYDTPPDKVRRASEILTEVYQSHKMTKDLIVSFNTFAASSLNIRVIHWWDGTDYKAYMAGMQEMNLVIQQRFNAEKISFAFPTQTLFLKQDSPWALGEPPKA